MDRARVSSRAHAFLSCNARAKRRSGDRFQNDERVRDASRLIEERRERKSGGGHFIFSFHFAAIVLKATSPCCP